MGELMEMHQIAMPATSMNMTGGTVSVGKTVKYGNRVVEESKSLSLSLVQAALQAVPQAHPGGSSRSNLVQGISNIPLLVDATQQAASHFKVCMHERQSSSLIQESEVESAEEESESDQDSEVNVVDESDEDEDGKPEGKS